MRRDSIKGMMRQSYMGKLNCVAGLIFRMRKNYLRMEICCLLIIDLKIVIIKWSLDSS